APVRRDLHGRRAMKLAAHRAFDALCGEYLLGTLRGRARQRFERALREEPRAASRLAHWQTLAPRYSRMIESQPSAQVWQKLERTLGLARSRTPWFQRARFWMGWAAAATAALVIVLGVQLSTREEPVGPQIAQLAGKESNVSAHLSGRTLVLR